MHNNALERVVSNSALVTASPSSCSMSLMVLEPQRRGPTRADGIARMTAGSICCGVHQAWVIASGGGYLRRAHVPEERSTALAPVRYMYMLLCMYLCPRVACDSLCHVVQVTISGAEILWARNFLHCVCQSTTRLYPHGNGFLRKAHGPQSFPRDPKKFPGTPVPQNKATVALTWWVGCCVE